jgi:hypothetical protein
MASKNRSKTRKLAGDMETLVDEGSDTTTPWSVGISWHIKDTALRSNTRSYGVRENTC